jgi:hypothetical protein
MCTWRHARHKWQHSKTIIAQQINEQGCGAVTIEFVFVPAGHIATVTGARQRVSVATVVAYDTMAAGSLG